MINLMIQFITWKVAKYGVISAPYSPVLGLNTEIYSVNLCIQFKYRKIRSRNNSVLGHFSCNDYEEIVWTIFSIKWGTLFIHMLALTFACFSPISHCLDMCKFILHLRDNALQLSVWLFSFFCQSFQGLRNYKSVSLILKISQYLEPKWWLQIFLRFPCNNWYKNWYLHF